MIKVPGIIILLLVAIFIEALLGYLSGLSIAIILSLLLYKRVEVKIFLAIMIPLSISMDIVNHTISGGSLLALIVISAIYAATQKYLPVDGNPFLKVGMTFLLLVLFHITYFAIFHISENRFEPELLNLSLLGNSIKLAIIELAIFLTVEYFIDFIGTGRDTKLKLK